MTYQQRLAIDAARNGYTALLGMVVDLPGYECTITSGIRPPHNLPNPTASATSGSTPKPTPKPTPSPTAKPGKSGKHSTSPKRSSSVTASAKASPSATPKPTATTDTRELYWHIEWKPVNYSSRLGDLLVGDQFMTFTAEVRQRDLAVLTLDTDIYGNQAKLQSMDDSQRLNAAYNLIYKLGFTPVSAYISDSKTVMEGGKKIMLTTSMWVKIKVKAENSETSAVKVVINEFSGKVIGFSMDESWY
jgi:hypothetical protein